MLLISHMFSCSNAFEIIVIIKLYHKCCKTRDHLYFCSSIQLVTRCLDSCYFSVFRYRFLEQMTIVNLNFVE